MSNLTRSNIAYNLNISPHRLEETYADQKLVYVFSSDLYRNKFKEKQAENRNKINSSLSNRFGFTIENDLLNDLKLYTTVEKRGFLIFCDGEKIECLNTIILDGKKLIIKS